MSTDNEKKMNKKNQVARMAVDFSITIGKTWGPNKEYVRLN